MNDFLVAETYSYALFNGIFFTRWVETTALITAFLFTLLSQGMWRRFGLCMHERFEKTIVPRHVETVVLLSREAAAAGLN